MNINIDLIFTAEGESGLLCDEVPSKKIIGALMDGETGLLSLEFADMDHLDMNIPIDSSYFDILGVTQNLHFGVLKNDHIAQAYQIPFMHLDDPYRLQNAVKQGQNDRALVAFEMFIKRCIVGQPVHRLNLSDDSMNASVLGDSSLAGLEFAPHLARQHAIQKNPKIAPASMPGISAPGLGGGSSSGGTVYRGTHTTTPNTQSKKDDKDQK